MNVSMLLLGLIPLLALPLIWYVVVSLLARLSGWTTLGERYACATPPEGRRFMGLSGKIGLVSYRRSLVFVVAPEGLFIAVFSLLSMGHKPLLIPWGDIHHIEQLSSRRYPATRFQVGDQGPLTLEIPSQVFDARRALPQ